MSGVADDLLEDVRGFLGASSDLHTLDFLRTVPEAGSLKTVVRQDRGKSANHLLAQLGHVVPSCQNLVAAVCGSYSPNDWCQPYSETDIGRNFWENSAWLPVADTAGPLVYSEGLIEFMLLGPKLVYPMRSHAPEELYIVLAGQLRAQVGGAEPRWFRGSEAIHHLPNQPHELLTGDETVLVLTIWRKGGFEKPEFLTATEAA